MSDVRPITGSRTRADELVRAAKEHLDNGDADAARQDLKLALMFDKDHSRAQAMLRRLPRKRRERSQSSARARMPSTPRARPRQPSVAGANAIELYDRANREAEMGDIDTAIATLERAIGMAQNAGFYNRLGVLLAKQREFDRADAAMLKACELSPNNATYQANREKILAAAATHTKRPTARKRSRSFIGALFGRED